jgi:hypothetical protein
MGRPSTKQSAERIGSKRRGKRAQVSQIEEYAKAVAGTEDDLDPALEAAAIETLLNPDDDT